MWICWCVSEINAISEMYVSDFCDWSGTDREVLRYLIAKILWLKLIKSSRANTIPLGIYAG